MQCLQIKYKIAKHKYMPKFQFVHYCWQQNCQDAVLTDVNTRLFYLACKTTNSHKY